VREGDAGEAADIPGRVIMEEKNRYNSDGLSERLGQEREWEREEQSEELEEEEVRMRNWAAQEGGREERGNFKGRTRGTGSAQRQFINRTTPYYG